MEMYQLATAEPYSFWYINLAAKRREDMFWLRFEQRMIPTRAPAVTDVLQDSKVDDGGLGLASDPQTRK